MIIGAKRRRAARRQHRRDRGRAREQYVLVEASGNGSAALLESLDVFYKKLNAK